MNLIKVVCSNCGFSREKPASALPQTRVKATCPQCHHTFTFDPPPPEESAPNSDTTQPGEAKHAEAEAVSLKRGLEAKGNKMLFGLFLALILLTVVVRLWADAREKSVPVPNLLAASESGVAIGVGQSIYHLAGDGKLLRSYTLPEGLHPTQLFWDKGSLCVGDMKNKNVLVFREGQTETFNLTGATISAQFKVTREPATGQLFVSDGAGHRILVFDQNGKYLRSFGSEGQGPGQFRFPNEVLFDELGQLVVANTKAPSIDIYAADGHYKNRLTPPSGDANFRYPSDFVITPDRLLVLEEDGYLQRGKVRIYSRTGEKIGELATGDADLLGDLVTDGQRVYVTDCEGRQLLTYSLPDLRPLPRFSPEFASLCADWNEEARFHKKISTGALVLLFVLSAPVIFFYVRFKHQQSREISQVTLDSFAASKPASESALPSADIILGTPVNAAALKKALVILGLGLVAMLLMAILSKVAAPPQYGLAALMIAMASIVMGVIALMRAGGFCDWKRRQTEGTFKKLIRDGLLPLQPEEQVERVAQVQQSQSAQDLALVVFTNKRLLLYSLNWEKVAGIRQYPFQAITKVVPPAPRKLATLFKLQIFMKSGGESTELKFFFQKPDFLHRLGEEFSSRAGKSGYFPSGQLCLSCLEPLQGEYCVHCATRLAPDRMAMWLSILFPGLGQLRNGEMQKGLTFTILAVVFIFIGYVGMRGWFFEGADLTAKQKFNLVILMIMAPLWYVANVVDAYRSSVRARRIK